MLKRAYEYNPAKVEYDADNFKMNEDKVIPRTPNLKFYRKLQNVYNE